MSWEDDYKEEMKMDGGPSIEDQIFSGLVSLENGKKLLKNWRYGRYIPLKIVKNHTERGHSGDVASCELCKKIQNDSRWNHSVAG